MADPMKGCGCMTSRTGCLIIGWLEVICLIPMLLLGLVALSLGFTGLPYTCAEGNNFLHESTCELDQKAQCITEGCGQIALLSGVVLLAVSTLYLFAPCCLIHGSSNGKSSFLIPYIICSILKNVASFVCVIAIFLASVELGFIFLIFFAIDIYTTVVVCCHYNYLTEKGKDDNAKLVKSGAYVRF